MNTFIVGLRFPSNPYKTYEYFVSTSNFDAVLKQAVAAAFKDGRFGEQLFFKTGTKIIGKFGSSKELQSVHLSYLKKNKGDNHLATRHLQSSAIISAAYLAKDVYLFMTDLLEKFENHRDIEKEMSELISKQMEKSKLTIKGDNKMKNTFSQFGQKITGIFGISLFDGSPAYRLKDTYVSVKDGALTDVSEFVMEMDMPGFTMPSLVKDVKVNDLLLVNGQLAVVVSVEENIRVAKGDGSITEISPVSNPLFGGAFVTKVMNPMAGMVNGQAQGTVGGFNPMMFMFMGEGKGDDSMFKNMMMMQMLQQNGGMFGGGQEPK